eukprot:g16986.t1
MVSLVGADEETFQRVKPLIALSAPRIIRCGDFGHETVVKILTNMLCAVQDCAMGEAWKFVCLSSAFIENMQLATADARGQEVQAEVLSIVLQNWGALAKEARRTPAPAEKAGLLEDTQLSMARMTEMKYKDGTVEEQFTPNWKNSLEAHRKTPTPWTGRTIFYRLQEHGALDDETQQDGKPRFKQDDIEDGLDNETLGDEHVLQAEGQEHEESEDWSKFNDEKLFRLSDPQEELDQEIFGREYAFQVGDIEQEIDEITDAFFAESAMWDDPEQEEAETFKEPGSSDDEDGDESQPQESHCALVHEAGYGILDTGCGRGLIGANTLDRHVKLLNAKGYDITELPEKMHTFRYGNGSADKTGRRVEIPVFVGGKELRVRLHVVPGEVPLLISKRLLKSLGAMIDLNDNKLVMTKAGVAAPIHEMKDNSYQINLLDLDKRTTLSTPEVDVMRDSKYHPSNEAKYKALDPKDVPDTECLKDTIARVMPYWEEAIVPELKAGKTVFVAAHGNSIRTPLVYELDADLKPIASPLAVEPLKFGRYLGDAEKIKAAAEAVKNQTKVG